MYEGVWEGGHITVTLDPKERFCGCGGVGHLEGIMGYRADAPALPRSRARRNICARSRGRYASAASSSISGIGRWPPRTASFIHLAGPGRFYFTGHNVSFLDVPLLRAHLESMVKMSPLQSFSLEVLPNDDETALLGAGVSALRALTW